MFIRNESFKHFIKFYPVTTVLLAVNLLVYLVFLITGTLRLAPEFAFHLFEFAAGSNNAILNSGSWWQLVTPIFLHISFGHILFNAFSLFIFGPALEIMLGKLRYAAAFLATGVIANIAALFLESAGFSHYGASGALFGLLGIYIYLVVFHRERIDRQDQTIIFVIVLISLISSFFGANIDVMGHLIGFLSGLVLAPLLFFGRLR
ncbi:rhomboid family intramembrane serine protease [Sporolactobacillus sp. CPB3-1]|uniref:Rhomboid family intramembrane serine protease n=1 Tax=Sporolactobacillus mangiferae TaxID=2940498 RepID=A0ABT0MCF1_9BACL|nr:rhomboid family intramembrane serine protease [Sporolactobacillus mangiferae]MCL1632348.1 rhomboid family intramembrane serine protease [Sporolactobacillus mangiferae]